MIKIEELKNVTTKALEEINVLLPQVSRSGATTTYAALLDFIKDPNVTLLIAKEGGAIIGMGTLVVVHTISGKRGKLEHLVIDGSHRGQGLGKLLSEKLIAIAREQKVKRLELTSGSDREAANALYQKLGFKKYETNIYKMEL